MRIGVFGGTFDPPHLGHMILAMEAYSQLKLDRLLWVLTPDPPHKRGRTPLELYHGRRGEVEPCSGRWHRLFREP